eukprot:gene17752-23187_t
MYPRMSTRLQAVLPMSAKTYSSISNKLDSPASIRAVSP